MSKETNTEDEDEEEDEEIVKLALPISFERDHTRGPTNALVTLIERGDYECPYTTFQ
jgi:hypothetical protein